ncbi:unnamed protein product [Musa acuminata var. zebrina]
MDSANPRPDKVAQLHKEYTIPHGHHLLSHTRADNYFNYVHSGVPRHIMIFEEDGWLELPEALSWPFIKGFREGRSSVNLYVNKELFLLIDFSSMVLINIRIRKMQSVAWMDEAGKSFLPYMALLQEGIPPTEFDAWILACGCGIQSASSLQLAENEVPISQQPFLYPVVSRLQRSSASFLAVQETFLSGMGPFATPASILDIYACNGRHRLEAFERQIEFTARERGNANVKYGWYGSTDNRITEALINGFGHSGRLSEVGILGTGIYLTPQDRAFASIRLCEVESGVQHMLLCRVIMGNVEQVRPGSKQYCPRKNYDMGVDNVLNPKCYIVWSTHLDKYIYPEYMVRFALPSRNKEYLCGLKDIRFHVEDHKAWYELAGSLEPFALLYVELHDRIAPWARRLFLHYLMEFKRDIITREVLIMKMGLFVQELLPAPETATGRGNDHMASSIIPVNTFGPGMESTSAVMCRITFLAMATENRSTGMTQPGDSASRQ